MEATGAPSGVSRAHVAAIEEARWATGQGRTAQNDSSKKIVCQGYQKDRKPSGNRITTEAKVYLSDQSYD